MLIEIPMLTVAKISWPSIRNGPSRHDSIRWAAISTPFDDTSPLQEYCELVTTEPSKSLASSDLGLNSASNLDNQTVAGRVTHGVVKDFEPVEVEEHDRSLALLPGSSSQSHRNLVHEVASVRQPSETVGKR